MRAIPLLFSALFCIFPIYADVVGNEIKYKTVSDDESSVRLQRFVDAKYENQGRFMASRSEAGEIHYRDLTVVNAGELEAALAEDLNSVDSLVVRGPINDDDFHTLWRGTYYGKLRVINLEHAVIENDSVPDFAFYNQSVQLEPESGYVNTVCLKKIILPEGLEVIGKMAFAYAISLEEVNFPSTLRRLETYAFSDCVSLRTDPLVFPEGFEETANLVFLNCTSLTGEVILPSTIRKLGDGTFFRCKISAISIPEGLETLGDAVFYATGLKEVSLPASCRNIIGTDHFALCYELRKVHLPEGWTEIPNSFVSDCLNLEEINIPSTVETIGRGAFYSCKALKSLNLPGSVKELNDGSCANMSGLADIHCEAVVPPVCIGKPFDRDVPVYVPVGTAEAYRNVAGWDFFSTFIEVDFSGVCDVPFAAPSSVAKVYDLNGREVLRPLKGHIYIQNSRKFIGK